MKYIVLIMLSLFVYADEQRMILTGFTIHEHTNDRFGEKYNGYNYGAGYEYNYFNEYNELYYSMNAMIFNDSFENPQFVFGMGHSYRFDLNLIDISVGLSGFVGVKKIYTDDDVSRDDGGYGVTGGIGPTMNLYYDNFSMNFVYVPGFKYKDLDTTGFLFTYFSYKF